MMRIVSTTLLLLCLAVPAAAQSTTPPAPPAASPSPAAEAPKGKLSGLVFGDYYFFAAHHLPAWEDQHGMWLRRAYLTYDHTFSPKVSARLRLEMNSNGKLAGGALTPYVKDAYVRWNFLGRQAVMVGIQPSLTFEHVESVWGLRHIEKTPLDLYRVDASRDTGITFSGPLNESQTLKYAVQYGNDSGSNAETDRFKGYRASARYETNPGFTAEVVVGQSNRDKEADRTLAQLFAGYRAPRGRVGAQYAMQTRRAAEGTPAEDIELDVFSGFAVFDLKPRVSSLFVRVDRFNDPCTDCGGIDYLPIDTKGPFTMTLAGIEYALLSSVRFSPNVEWVSYSEPEDGSPTPKNDVAARLTFYWTF